MPNQYGDNEKVQGGVLRRAKRRARKQGRTDVLKGGVTGAEARSLRPKGQSSGRRAISRRAKSRLDQIGPVGGVNPRDGISMPEARKVRQAWQTEQRFNPNIPRNGRQIRSLGEALVDIEYAPQDREIQNALKNEQGRANVMNNWFQGYQDDVARIGRENMIANQAFQQGAYTAAQQAFAGDTAAVGQRQQQSSDNAAKFGATVDPSVAMGAQQAAGARQQQGIAFGNTLGQIGVAQAGLFGQRQIAAGQQRMEVLAESQARQAKVQELAQELAGQKGKSLTATIGKLQDSEHTKQMERNAFGLDVQQAQTDAADKAADNKRLARKDRQTAARNRLLNAQTRANIRKTKGELALDRTADLADDGRRNHSQDYSTWKDGQDGGTPSGFTPKQVRDNRSSFENGISRGRGVSGKSYQWHVAKLQAAGYDELMAKVVAWKVARSGRVPAGLLNRFKKRYGFRPSARGAKRNPQNHEGSLTPRNADGTPG